MSVQVSAWLIALVKDGGQGHPCSTVKAWSGHTAVSRPERDSNSCRWPSQVIFRHRSASCLSCHLHSLPISVEYYWAFPSKIKPSRGLQTANSEAESCVTAHSQFMSILAQCIFPSCMHGSKRFLGAQSRDRIECWSEKEPRKAARLCCRSGCDKEATFVPRPLLSLCHTCCLFAYAG